MTPQSPTANNSGELRTWRVFLVRTLPFSSIGKPLSFNQLNDLLPVHINLGYKIDGCFCVISISKAFKFLNRFLFIFLPDLTFNKIGLFGHLFLKEKAISIPANPPPIITNGFAEESFLWISWSTINL